MVYRLHAAVAKKDAKILISLRLPLAEGISFGGSNNAALNEEHPQ